jgi:hypothetical protein
MRKSIATFALLLSIAAVGIASPAVASAPNQSSTRHCVVNLDTGRVTCASDQQQARRLSDVGAAAVRLAVFYDYTGYNEAGGTLTFEGAECSPTYDIEYGLPDLGAFGWNNRISSVQTFNRCDVKFFGQVNYEGASSTWIDQAPNLGTIGDGWNNRAGSVRIS